jgi:hypothetical protein
MQEELGAGVVQIFVEMVDTVGIERGGTPLETVDFVSLFAQ